MTTRGYVIETNRVIGDSFDRFLRWLQRAGIRARRLPHLTSAIIFRPPGMRWKEFLRLLASLFQDRRGSAVLTSQLSGDVYVLNNRGNRPGKFIKMEAD